MLVYLISGAIYGFAAGVQPGPLSAYLISQSLKNGWQRTIPAALSPLISDGPIAMLALLALSRVPAELVLALRLLGGAFVLYLAADAWRAWRSFPAEGAVSNPSPGHSMIKAALVNLLNPSPYLGWTLVLGPMVLKGWGEAAANGIAVVAGFYATLIASLTAIILVFHTARNLGLSVNRVLIAASAMALAGFGLYQLWAGVSALAAR
jgi:threonine/homoserine/homoserine lactone efflux protein